MNQQASTNSQTLPPGTRIQEFEVQSVVGTGGFAVTYRGWDHILSRTVAIKEFLPAELTQRESTTLTVQARSERAGDYRYGLDKFLEEARLLAQFSHPNVVDVKRLIEAHNTAYLVMAYEEGESLSDYLQRVKVPLGQTECLNLIIPVLRGLQAVHNTGFLHRDIKPGNIYLRHQRTPMLIDFGAARQAIGEHSLSVTGIVTPGYAPHEQYSSDASKQGPWSDLYAVGATLYRCITGKDPIDAPTRSHALLDGDPDPLAPASRQCKGRYDAFFLDTIDALLTPAAKQRPQTALAVLERLTGTQQPAKTVLLSAEEKGIDSHAADVLPVNPANVPEPVVLTAEPVAPAINVANNPGQRNILAGAIALALAVGGFYLGKQDTAPVLPPVDTPVVSQTVVEPVVTPPVQPLVQPVVLSVIPSVAPSVAQPIEQTETATLTNSAVADSQATQPEPAVPPSYPVKIRVHPADAKVVLDYLTYREDMTRPAGRYELRVEKAGYKPYLGTVEVEDHAVVREINLAPMTSGLTINTTPANARVRILNIGPAYTDGIQLAPGEYHLEVSARGYKTKEEWITLDNRDVTYSMVLEKKKDLAAELGLEFVTIPAGSFMMGSNDASDDEKPVHRVEVPSFKLMKYEVTQGQWQSVMGSNPSFFSNCGKDCPVEQVSWNDAQHFIKKLNQQTGQIFRLPSEAEWEYAARAGTTTAFAFGDQITTDQANFDGNDIYNGSHKGIYRDTTLPVNSFQPNAWGLYNMHGNVWEWTEDCWNDSYQNHSNSYASMDGDCEKRVMRGGSWDGEPSWSRSANRRWSSVAGLDMNIGFRLVQGR